MSTAERPPQARLSLPDHTQLPDHDGNFVKNFQEHPQSVLLTVSIEPVLDRLHPDGRFAIGQDCGIYWRLADPLERGAVCPDWFYVPNVPPMLDGIARRSYVMWQEFLPPLIVLEFVSGDGSEERDRTPISGKFWIYERVIRPAFYGIYEVEPGRIEMYHHVNDHFQPLPPNERGIWRGRYQALDLPWMRWWDEEGQLLPTGFELAEQEANRAGLEAERADREAERAAREAQRAAHEAERAERLAAQLRALGIEPEA